MISSSTQTDEPTAQQQFLNLEAKLDAKKLDAYSTGFLQKVRSAVAGQRTCWE